MSNAAKMLKCPLCGLSVSDDDFIGHICKTHWDQMPKKEKSRIRWADGLRIEAGGRLAGTGEGRGVFLA